jgi:hypothetical protein
MKNLLKLAVFLLIFSGVASSCNPEPDKEYPQNISFTEYSLPETSCHWVNLLYDDKVLMINSNEELEKYISCAKGSYPAIDFSKHTLLLASGKTTSGISKVNAKKIQQILPDKYVLNMEILINKLLVDETWYMSSIAEKMNKENTLDLAITYLSQEHYLPLDKTWILVEKEINGVKESLPEDEPYPVTLTFFSDTAFRGRCDENTYKGIYFIQSDNISLIHMFMTDGSATEWVLNYIDKLSSFNKIALTDTTMQLKSRSLICYFVSKEKFEKDYFKLEEWYNY